MKKGYGKSNFFLTSQLDTQSIIASYSLNECEFQFCNVEYDVN